jgi:FkbM family methyltransferase
MPRMGQQSRSSGPRTWARSAAGRGLAEIVSRLPPQTLARLESAAQLGQGKGWGATTVEHEVAAVLSLARRGSGPLVAYDVGANVGDWTAELVRQEPGARIVAFEPGAEAYARLSDRCSEMGTVTVVNKAVGREPGLATLWSDAPGSGLASLDRRRLDHFGIDFSHSEPVEVVTLDSWAEQAGVTPSVLKLDVEGREMDVLCGATALLDSVDLVQFEFGGCNIDSRTFFQDFWYFFTERRFAISRLGPHGLTELNRYRETDEFFQTTNYFACRR